MDTQLTYMSIAKLQEIAGPVALQVFDKAHNQNQNLVIVDVEVAQPIVCFHCLVMNSAIRTPTAYYIESSKI